MSGSYPNLSSSQTNLSVDPAGLGFDDERVRSLVSHHIPQNKDLNFINFQRIIFFRMTCVTCVMSLPFSMKLAAYVFFMCLTNVSHD